MLGQMVHNQQRIAGLACTDISTGEFFVGEFDDAKLVEVLESLTPAEILIPKPQKNELTELIQKLSFQPAITKLEQWIFDLEFSREALKGHFKTQSLKGFGIEDYTTGIAASGAVMHYIKETQQGKLGQLGRIFRI